MCRGLLTVLTVAYVVVLVGYATDSFGWLDAETAPLSAVVLMILGLPWILFPLGHLIDQAYWPVVGAVAPLFNLVILRLICRRLAR